MIITYQKSSRGQVVLVVSLEGYINSCIKYCVLRYMTNKYKDKDIIREYINEDGKDLSIFFDTPAIKNQTLILMRYL